MTLLRVRFQIACWFVLALSLGCASAKTNELETDTLFGKDLVAMGRTALKDGSLELISSASHFAFSFKGRDCKLYVSLSDWQSHNYLQYEVDGVYQKRIRIGKSDQQPLVISSTTDGKHTVTVYKATEAHTGPIFIQKLAAPAVQAVRPAGVPMIEFIGNSITCGAAADPSEVPCGTGVYHDQHNAYYAYGPRVAKALQTNFLLSSVSGIGIYRNWNSDGPTMPQVYSTTDFQQGSNRVWRFSQYQPVVVSIALGTNDFSNGDGKRQRLPFDSAAFVTNYIRFVQTVKSIYPKARIALLSSPMINGQPRELLQNCIAAVKTNIDRIHPADKPVAVYFFKPMQPRGCTWHPSVEDHAIMAAELVPFFKNLLQ